MRKPKWVINTKENFWYDYDYFELEIPILWIWFFKFESNFKLLNKVDIKKICMFLINL